MKRIVFLIGACALVVSGMAQISLTITTDKTTSLIFPFPIRHVDRGTKDILVQQVKEADNVLLVKAAAKEFTETNLSVVTGDGSIYSFPVCYDNKPLVLVHFIPASNKASVASYANGILDNSRQLRGVNDRKWEMLAEVTGIYVKDAILFYQLRLSNESPIDYNIDLLRFFIKDKRRGKRTAVQENEVTPVYIAGNTSLVRAFSKNVLVIALDKFTIPDAKVLSLQVMEKNGGRHLQLSITNRHIVRAAILPDLK